MTTENTTEREARMKLKKEDLKEVSYLNPGATDSTTGAKVVSLELVDEHRWENEYEQVLAIEGKFYRTRFRLGKTENQESWPYEYEPDEIELTEVFPFEKTIIECREA